MEFINSWLDEESGNMRKFLDLVSGPPPEDWIHGLGEQRGALGRHLSSLHTVLVENVGKVGTIQYSHCSSFYLLLVITPSSYLGAGQSGGGLRPGETPHYPQ